MEQNDKIFIPEIKVDMYDEEANKIVYNILNCTTIQIRTDKTFLYNLIQLKNFYRERKIAKGISSLLQEDEEKSFTLEPFSKYTIRTIEINGKIQSLTYFELCLKLFNLNEKTVNNYCTIANKFLKDIDNIPARGNAIVEYTYLLFEKYTLSKICELSSLMDWQIANLIKAEIITEKTSRDELRAICKRCKELGNQYLEYTKEDFYPKQEDEEEKVKTEEPEFNIDSEDYDLYSFKCWSKGKLTLIAFDLYNEVKSLRKKIKKMKGGAI